jgi:hypothetical protein
MGEQTRVWVICEVLQSFHEKDRVLEAGSSGMFTSSLNDA